MGATQSTAQKCILDTPRGSLKGVEILDKDSKQPVCRRFTKVPYALPPTGLLRWRRPQALPVDFTFKDASGGPGDYTAFGPICPQPFYDMSGAVLENPNAAPPIENVQDEDCLYLNIWLPAGDPPKGGWPVQMYIHGGWLQMGDAIQNNNQDPFDLFKDTKTPRIIVAPTYRLNLFGFLAGPVLADAKEDPTPGNYGFWDQRLALEWIHSNISLFGGDLDNITVGGLSAGANSTFFQLYYDTFLPQNQRIIKRIFLWSNAVGIQPPAVTSDGIAEQFDELATSFSISKSLTSAKKLEKLRKISSEDLVRSIHNLNLHTFRATTDSSFISPKFLASIADGSFTSQLKKNGTKILLGEVSDEELLYRLINPPHSLDTLNLQLTNYYPEPVVHAMLKHYKIPPSHTSEKEWADIFGIITADGQIYATERGFINSLFNPPNKADALTTTEVFRYRIPWRAQSLDNWLNPKVGICHAADGPIWWRSGWRAGYTEEDKQRVREFVEPFEAFLKGERVEWGTKTYKEVRQMGKNDGKIEIVEDQKWDRGLEIWNAMMSAQL